MSYAPFWVLGLGLAAVPLAHWLWVRRMLAVSGRYSAVVDAALAGKTASEPEMSQEELVAALRAATAAEFGEAAVGAAVEPVAPTSQAPAIRLLDHFLFFLAIVGGGALARVLSGAPSPAGGGAGDALFHGLFGASPLVAVAVLCAGGLLVGFGTRMAGGCTSGHGLCGMSRLQPGSLVATACFFGAGIAVSFLLRSML